MADGGHHALLFTGAPGSGKHARLLAEARRQLLGDSTSDGVFNAASHPDCHVLMSEETQASEQIPEVLRQYALRYLPDIGKRKTRSRVIAVDTIRQLIRQVYEHPMMARSKVVIIARCETMNISAANALLKALEEPPGDTRFLLASATPWRLPPTILSRCLRQHLALADEGDAPGDDPQWARALELADGQVAQARAWLADGRFAALQAVSQVIDDWLADPRSTADGSQQLAKLCADNGERFHWALYRRYRDYVRQSLPQAGAEQRLALFRQHDALIALLQAVQSVNADVRLQLHAWLVEWALLNHRYRS